MTHVPSQVDFFEEHTNAAERAVIAGILSDPNGFEQAGLTGSHFFNPHHGSIWEAIGSLRARGQDVDAVAVGNVLGGRLESVGGMTYISGLMV